MFTVNSQYKNPDKHIRILKKEIENLKVYLQNTHDENQGLIGEQQFSYKHVRVLVSTFADSSTCPSLLPLDKIRIAAHISSVKRDKAKGTEITIEVDKVFKERGDR